MLSSQSPVTAPSPEEQRFVEVVMAKFRHVGAHLPEERVGCSFGGVVLVVLGNDCIFSCFSLILYLVSIHISFLK